MAWASVPCMPTLAFCAAEKKVLQWQALMSAWRTSCSRGWIVFSQSACGPGTVEAEVTGRAEEPSPPEGLFRHH